MTHTQNKEPSPIILASTSPFRRELLNKLGLVFTVDSPNVDETRLDGETPEALVKRLAEAKAKEQEISSRLLYRDDINF